MKTSHQTRRDAASLLRACTVTGSLDENRVRRAVQLLVTRKPRGYINTLFRFRRLVQLDLARRSAKIESAIRLPEDMRAEVRNRLEKTYGSGVITSFSENPALIGGVRIQVGSDVYDGTVDRRLNAIERDFQ